MDFEEFMKKYMVNGKFGYDLLVHNRLLARTTGYACNAFKETVDI